MEQQKAKFNAHLQEMRQQSDELLTNDNFRHVMNTIAPR